MYGCESWIIRKSEHQRMGAFKLWCWRRFLRIPRTAMKSNQSILKEINPEYSLEGLMLKLEAPILCPPDVKTWSIGKDPDAGKDWAQEKKRAVEDELVVWHHRLMDMSFSKFWEIVNDREAWRATVHWVTKIWTWLSNWTTTHWPPEIINTWTSIQQLKDLT